MMKPPVMEPNSESQFQPTSGEVIPLFATPIFRGELQLDHNQVAQDVRRIVGKSRERHGKDDVARNYTTYFDYDLREETERLPWFTEFANQIKDTYVLYIRDTFGQNVEHLSRHDIHLFAWINHYKEPHQHEVHNHVNCNISGTYYVHTQETCQPIKFWSPNLMAQFSHGVVDQSIQRDGYDTQGTEQVETEAHFYPTNGQYLLWPSYLQHAVPPIYNVGEEYERISISFNLKHRLRIDATEGGDKLNYDFLGGQNE